MKFILVLLLSFVAVSANAAQPCLTFDGDSYCLAWASVDGSVTSNEYVRSGESVEAWTRMVTVKKYAGTTALKDVLPSYINYVRPMLALKPDIFVPNKRQHEDEAVLLLLLLAPDKSHYEYVVHHIYVDNGQPVLSVIFSLRIPFAEKIPFDDVLKSRDKWITQLSTLNPVVYTSVSDALQ